MREVLVPKGIRWAKLNPATLKKQKSHPTPWATPDVMLLSPRALLAPGAVLRDNNCPPPTLNPHPYHSLVPSRPQFVEHLGYVSLFPLLLRLLPADAAELAPTIELLRDPARLWSPYGIRSLSAADKMWYERQNAPGDAPYWRGAIWVNLNYLALAGLHHYASVAGPARARAAEVYTELREALVGNMRKEWVRTGYFWEQYDPRTGKGQRTHPFNGWSSLALLALAEIY
jgi:hypothetical protein